MAELVLKKKGKKAETKPIIIDAKIVNSIKKLSKETGLSIREITEFFLNESLKNVVVEG